MIFHSWCGMFILFFGGSYEQPYFSAILFQGNKEEEGVLKS